MKILNISNESVLWLLDDSEIVKENIFKKASNKGICKNRIIFAQRIDRNLHLSRLTLADLFLDSYPCNAHTTASDALLVNLPILTISGKTMSSRVAGSLLKELKLDSLICENFQEYIEKAIFFKNNKNSLINMKKRITKNKENNPIFSAKYFASNLEKGYKIAWNNFINNKKQDIKL